MVQRSCAEMYDSADHTVACKVRRFAGGATVLPLCNP